MRRAGAGGLLLASTLALGGCIGSGGPSGGYADLDALQKFQASCAAQGLVMKLKPDGDPQAITAYECVRK